MTKKQGGARSKSWLIDSGASDHMTGNMELLINRKTLRGKIKVGLPDGSVIIVCEMGVVILNYDITLKNVLYIDDFNHNFLSVVKLLQEKKIQMIFNNHECILQDRTFPLGEMFLLEIKKMISISCRAILVM